MCVAPLAPTPLPHKSLPPKLSPQTKTPDATQTHTTTTTTHITNHQQDLTSKDDGHAIFWWGINVAQPEASKAGRLELEGRGSKNTWFRDRHTQVRRWAVCAVLWCVWWCFFCLAPLPFALCPMLWVRASRACCVGVRRVCGASRSLSPPQNTPLT